MPTYLEEAVMRQETAKERLGVRKLDAFGAEITGLDLSRDPDEELKAELYRLWLQHGILVFPGSEHDGKMQVRLAQCFGPLQIHPVEHVRVQGEPELIFLGGKDDPLPIQYVDGEARRGVLYWHSDMTYVPEINKGSLLRIVEQPFSGGLTSWADAAAAYDDLSPAMKERLANLSAVHVLRSVPERAWGEPGVTIEVADVDRDNSLAPGRSQQFAPVLQPLVIRHGETGRQSLLLSPLSFVKIDGLSTSAGEDLFELLVQHALKPEYRYTHDWSVGDMILWDNRRTMHCAHGYPIEGKRLAIRASLAEGQTTGRLYSQELSTSER